MGEERTLVGIYLLPDKPHKAKRESGSMVLAVDYETDEIEGQAVETNIETKKEPVVEPEDGDQKVESSYIESEANDQDAGIQFLDEMAGLHEPPNIDVGNVCCGCKQTNIKLLNGLFIVIGITISWTGLTQFAKSTYSPTFNAPFFTTWFSTCFMIVVYPLFLLPLICKKTPFRLSTFFLQSAAILGPQGLCVQSIATYLFKYIFAFTCIWLVTNYLYFRGLVDLNPGTQTAVFSSSSCFVYVLSLVILRDCVYFIRFFAVLLSISGIVLMSYTEGFGSLSAHGVVFVACSALGSALYQVSFFIHCKRYCLSVGHSVN